MTAYVIITLIFKYRLAPAGERRISFAHMRLSERAQIRRAITDCIGEQQIDIVVSDAGAEPFFRHASDLRNDIAHEYETDELAELFGSTLELTPVLLSIAQAIFRYCSEKGYQSV